MLESVSRDTVVGVSAVTGSWSLWSLGNYIGVNNWSDAQNMAAFFSYTGAAFVSFMVGGGLLFKLIVKACVLFGWVKPPPRRKRRRDDPEDSDYTPLS